MNLNYLHFFTTKNRDTIDICQNLCEDSQLINEILEFILQLWNRCLPYEEKNGMRFASLTPLIATSILTEIFSNNTTANTEQVFNKNFEKTFSALLVRTASTLSSSMPIPKSKVNNLLFFKLYKLILLFSFYILIKDESQPEQKKSDSKNAPKNDIQGEYKKLDPCK